VSNGGARIIRLVNGVPACRDENYLETAATVGKSIVGAQRAPAVRVMSMNSAWNELVTTDVGLMSLAVIVGMLVIAAVIAVIIRRKINES
jgi:hypothetical protein